MAAQLHVDPTAPRVEADVRSLGMQLLRKWGCHCYSTSQYRRSKVSEGIPDHLVFDSFAGFAFVEWKHPEFKHPDGDKKHPMSDEQKEFRSLCAGAGIPYLLVSRIETLREWLLSARGPVA